MQAIFAALVHSMGKILSTAFSWATVLLFGRVDEKQQLLMSVSMFGSIIWLAAVIGIAFPSVGMFLLAAFVPPAVQEHHSLVRLVMLAAAAVIPFIVGLILVFGRDRHNGKSDWRNILYGWPYTIGLAITLVMMTCFAPVLKLQTLLKKWTSDHIPVLVPATEYAEAVNEIETVLERAGYSVHRQQASWMLRLPTRVLTFFAGKGIEQLVASDLKQLSNGKFTILLHPSDLIISANKRDVAHLRALLTEHLMFGKLLFTKDASANKLERRLQALWISVRSGLYDAPQMMSKLQDVDRDISRLDMSYDDWEVLFREKLQIEHLMLLNQSSPPIRRAS